MARIACIHGLGGTGTDTWKHVIAELAEEFRVVVYDVRGSGISEATPGPYTIDLLQQDLDTLVSALELGRVGLMGHSLGGGTVLAQAARHEMGVALIPPFLIQRELGDGSLVVALDRAAPHNDRAYYLMVPERKAESAALQAFRDWLLLQASAYRQG